MVMQTFHKARFLLYEAGKITDEAAQPYDEFGTGPRL